MLRILENCRLKKSPPFSVFHIFTENSGEGERKEGRGGEKENRYHLHKMSNSLVNIFIIRDHSVLTRLKVCECECACLSVCTLMNNSLPSVHKCKCMVVNQSKVFPILK